MQLAHFFLERIDSLCVHVFKSNHLLVLRREFSLEPLGHFLLYALNILDRSNSLLAFLLLQLGNLLI